MPEPVTVAAPATRRSRPVMAAAGAAIAAAGGIFTIALIATAGESDLSIGASAFASGVLILISGSVLAGGLYLVYLGAPSLPGRLRAAGAASLSWECWRSRVRALVRTP